jgi:hypothetical protein
MTVERMVVEREITSVEGTAVHTENELKGSKAGRLIYGESPAIRGHIPTPLARTSKGFPMYLYRVFPIKGQCLHGPIRGTE